MADRLIQNYLSSGEASEIRLGGIGDEKKAVIQEEVTNVPKVGEYGYGCFETDSVIELNPVFQKVTVGWSDTARPNSFNVTNVNGDITVAHDGVYKIDFSRVYHNHDINPQNPVRLYIEVRVNDVNVGIARSSLISPSNGVNDESVLSFTTPCISRLTAGDSISFWVRAEEEVTGATPEQVELVVLRMTIYKVFN